MGRRRNLSGMRMLITGASQGIGRASAVAAARRGVKLILTARSADLLQELADELQKAQADFITVVADVTKPEDRQRMLNAAVDHFGGLDILVNNAGIGATGHFSDATEERLRSVFEVNFFALAEMTRLAIPTLRQGNLPLIVNVSSIVGKRAVPARSEYSASKYAVQGLSEAIRAELVRYDIDLLTVCPGLTATNFPKNMLENKARWPLDHTRSMTPEQVAEASLRAMEKGKREILLTFSGRFLVLINRLFPGFVDWLMARKVRKVYQEEIAQRQQQNERDKAAAK
jgi:short-subunit dehydrogenase